MFIIHYISIDYQKYRSYTAHIARYFLAKPLVFSRYAIFG